MVAVAAMVPLTLISYPHMYIEYIRCASAMDAVVAFTLIPPFAMTAIECDYCSGCHGALTLIPPLAITAMNAMVLLTLIPHERLLQWNTITAMDATVPLTLIPPFAMTAMHMCDRCNGQKAAMR